MGFERRLVFSYLKRKKVIGGGGWFEKE
jgi:hypothetical protein